MAENMKISENIREFATVAFTLLGILFGMILMTFIFGQLGPSSSGLTDDTITKTNITGAYINDTLYTITEAANSNFNGDFVVTLATNSSDGGVIPSGNYTVDATAGTITNATVTVWTDVNLTYTFSQKTSAREATEDVQNNSLNAIVTYTEQSDTQFTTVAIAITLIILIAVFLIFWRIFVSKKQGGKGDSGGAFA